MTVSYPPTLKALLAVAARCEPATARLLASQPHLAASVGGDGGRVSMARGFVWAHAASGGDLRSLRGVLGDVRATTGREVLATVVTATGMDAAREAIAEGWVSAVMPAPIGQPAAARRLVALGPAALVVERLELWPALLAAARAGGVPVVLHNGRLSARSAARWGLFPGVLPALLGGLRAGLMQSVADAERLASLCPGLSGVITVAPSSKLGAARAPSVAVVEALRARYGLGPGRPVRVAGSLRRQEFGPVLVGAGPGRMVLAPRHPAQAGACLAAVRASGRRGALASDVAGARRAEVIVVDTFGGLPAWYGLASEAFVGGTLAPVGGHSPVEAWAAGAPVVVGPHVEAIAGLLERFEGAVRRVPGAPVWGGEPAALAGEGLAEAVRRGAEEARRVASAQVVAACAG